MNKEKIDADENKFEREVQKDKKSGILTRSWGGDKVPASLGGQQFICLFIQSFPPSIIQNNFNDELDTDSPSKEFIIQFK